MPQSRGPQYPSDAAVSVGSRPAPLAKGPRTAAVVRGVDAEETEGLSGGGKRDPVAGVGVRIWMHPI